MKSSHLESKRILLQELLEDSVDICKGLKQSYPDILFIANAESDIKKLQNYAERNRDKLSHADIKKITNGVFSILKEVKYQIQVEIRNTMIDDILNELLVSMDELKPERLEKPDQAQLKDAAKMSPSEKFKLQTDKNYDDPKIWELVKYASEIEQTSESVLFYESYRKLIAKNPFNTNDYIRLYDDFIDTKSVNHINIPADMRQKFSRDANNLVVEEQLNALHEAASHIATLLQINVISKIPNTFNMYGKSIEKISEKTNLLLTNPRKYFDALLLIDKKNINKKIDESGDTPLHYIIRRADKFDNVESIIDNLINKGANPNTRGSHNQRPIDYIKDALLNKIKNEQTKKYLENFRIKHELFSVKDTKTRFNEITAKHKDQNQETQELFKSTLNQLISMPKGKYDNLVSESISNVLDNYQGGFSRVVVSDKKPSDVKPNTIYVIKTDSAIWILSRVAGDRRQELLNINSDLAKSIPEPGISSWNPNLIKKIQDEFTLIAPDEKPNPQQLLAEMKSLQEKSRAQRHHSNFFAINKRSTFDNQLTQMIKKLEVDVLISNLSNKLKDALDNNAHDNSSKEQLNRVQKIVNEKKKNGTLDKETIKQVEGMIDSIQGLTYRRTF